MIGIFALWEGIEELLFTSQPPFPLGLFYLIRGVSTAVLMAALAAWLMLRYRRGFEERLRQESEKAQRMRVFFENIVQDAGEAIISLDTHGVIRTWNRAAESIYGYTAGEMVGQPLRRLVPPDLRESGELQALEDLLARNDCVRDYETRRLHKDGTILEVRITRSLLRDPEGRIIGSSAIVRDVSQEKSMESRLIQAEKLAAIGQTAAGIAHEVRNALAGISGTVQVLKGHPAWKDLPEGVAEEVDTQVARIAHIVNDLLTYARPGSIHPKRSDLGRVLDRALAVSSSVPEASGKRVERRYDRRPVLAEVDPASMEQAITNVVTNAYQAMRPGGVLRVATSQSNGGITITIADDGCGMTADVAARAFEPFFTTKVRGTGLGLPIVRSIVEAHHGTVRLESEPNRGTTVIMTLPTAAGSHSQEEDPMRYVRPGIRRGVAALAVFGFLGFALAAEPQYVGESKCRACHLAQHKAWSATKHAGAFETLKPEDRSKPECLACHTTGHGKSQAAGAQLTGVQCEACHGPGSLYKSPTVMSKTKYKADPKGAHAASVELGLTPITEQVCTACHNAKSPSFKGFDFASAKEKIKH